MHSNLTNWHLATSDQQLAEFLREKRWQSFAELVKRQDGRRSVYRVAPPNSSTIYYIKHDHPASLRNRVKFLWRCKSETEYDCAMKLSRRGVKTVPTIGWGENGTESYLVTEEIPGTVDFSTIWEVYRRDTDKRAAFVEKLISFVTSLREGGVHHRDFHPGNFLVRGIEHDECFFLVDFSNIEFKESLTRRQRFPLIMWLLGVFNDIDRHQQFRICEAAGLCECRSELDRTLFQAGQMLVQNSYRRWTNRRKRVLSEIKKATHHDAELGDLVLKSGIDLVTIREIITNNRSTTNATMGTEETRHAPAIIESGVGKFAVLAAARQSRSTSIEDSILLVLHRLQWHGNLATEPIAWLKSPDGQEWILYEAETTYTLHQVLNRSTPTKKRTVLSGLAKFIARIHNYRIIVPHLQASAIALTFDVGNDSPQFRLWTNQTDIRFAQSIKVDQRSTNLNRIFASLQQQISDIDQCRILSVYARSCNLSRAESRQLLKATQHSSIA